MNLMAQSPPTNMRCEYQTKPLAIDTLAPRLSWQLNDNRRGAKQRAYQILVAANPRELDQDKGTLWDTGKVESSQSNQIEYAGKPLQSRARCFWKVRVWDMAGKASEWSEHASWEMGLLEKSDWTSEWIGMKWPEEKADPYAGKMGEWIFPYNRIDKFEYWNRQPAYNCFRKKFNAARTSAEASIFLQTDKPYIVYLNGQVLADTNANRENIRKNRIEEDLENTNPPIVRIPVGDKLKAGENLLAVQLYRPADVPIAAMRCGLVFGDAKMKPLLSDRSWFGVAVDDPEEPSGMGPVPYVKAPDDWFTMDFEPVAPGNAKGETRNLWFLADSSGIVHPFKNRRSISLRRDFNVKGPVRSARLYATALGNYEMALNGNRASDDFMAPGKGNYDCYYHTEGSARHFNEGPDIERLLEYQVHDVTSMLRQGPNTIGAMLGNGWYNMVGFTISCRKPLLRAQLEIVYEDGSTERVQTDASWQTTPSPVVFDSVHLGEHYDARLEQAGWKEAGFDAGKWAQAEVLSPAYEYHYAQSDEPTLMAEAQAPMRITEELKPLSIERISSDTQLVNFGQLASGIIRLTVRDSQPGNIIRLNYSYKPAGPFAARFCNQSDDLYICKGEPVEKWERKFGYGMLHSVRVQGFPGELRPEDISYCIVNTDLKKVGTFSCSNETVNRIWRAIEWTWRGNIHSVPVDTDREKIMWAEFSLHSGALPWMFDTSRFAPRMLHMYHGPGNGIWCAGWGDGVVWWPYYGKLFYDDERFAKNEYHRAKFFVDDRIQNEKEGYWAHGTFGDWHGLNKQSEHGGMFGAAHHYQSIERLAWLAQWLGKEEEATAYRQHLPTVARAFHRTLYDPEKKTYPGDNQRALAIPLSMGFVADSEKQQVQKRFVEMVAQCDRFLKEQWKDRPRAYEKLRARCLESGGNSLDYAPTVGLYGNPFFLWALTAIDRNDIAWKVLSRNSYPSWGYTAANGGALSEAYGSYSSHTGRTNIAAWIFQEAGGINADPRHPGFKRFIVRPQIMGDLMWAKTTYQSPYGLISLDWKRDSENNMIIKLTVPPNSTALVHLPAPAGQALITESGKPLDQAEGVQLLAAGPEETPCELVAGNYVFEISPKTGKR